MIVMKAIHKMKLPKMNYWHLAAVAGMLMFSQCQRIDTFEGPSLSDLYGDFTIQEDFAVSKPDVNFSLNENVHFTARFSRLSDWRIEIKSQSSGSVKVIEGRSRELDASNASWDGTTTTFPVFSEGLCDVTLWVEADSSEHTSTINVTGVRQPEAIVVSDFEGPFNPEWDLFAQTGANMSFRIESRMRAPVGNQYFDMGGRVDWDWLLGYIDFPASSMGADGFGLPSNPDNLYFNAVVYRPDSLPNGFLLFRFNEDDNGDGSFNESTEDQYAVQVEDLESGWNIISFKYADLAFLINGNPGEPRGNKAKNPDRLAGISCLLLANPASGYAQVLMDHIVFTNGAPLKL
jgi:hypothetical protein